MAWKILLTARAAVEAGDRGRALFAAAGCDVAVADPLGPLASAALVEAAGGHDAIVASSDAYDADFFAAPAVARLKCVSRWGVGLDNVDLAAATRAGVVVCNTPGMLDEAVADYTFALLFAVARQVATGERVLRGGRWSVAWGHEIHSRTLGIVGCGRIGRAVARRAAGFGMRVLGYDPLAGETPGIDRVDLERLLCESDFVSLHCALTPQSRGLLDAGRIALMKPTAYLVNTSRGAIVDEAALVAALESGRIAGAALDAFVAEPLPAASPLLSCPRLLLTPHQAFNSVETGEAVSLAAAGAIVDLMAGRRPAHVANPDVLAAPQARVRVSV